MCGDVLRCISFITVLEAVAILVEEIVAGPDFGVRKTWMGIDLHLLAVWANFIAT